MPIRVARAASTNAGLWRAGQCLGLAALALLVGNTSLQNAVAEGDTRTISLHHLHTGEDLTVTFKRNGRYDEEALKKVNHELRDWRRNEEIRMDPRLLDVVWEVSREVDAKEAIQVVCGYRSPATNAMLRRRSRGVAEQSQHMLGRAMDFYIPGVSLEKQREAGLRLQRGGVGYYPSSGSPFVHMDVGNVRMWPRMSHDQLARVFPDGRTVHIPSDGRPLSGYALALADIEKRGSSGPSQMSLDAARGSGVDAPRRSLFAARFDKDEAEDHAATADKTPAPKAAVARTLEAKRLPLAPAPSQRTAQTAPATPAVAFTLASAESRPVSPTPAAHPSDVSSPPSANDVITSRGFWPEPGERTAAAQKLAAAARAASRASEPQRVAVAEATRAIAPWPVRTTDAADRVPPEVALAYAGQARAPSGPVSGAGTVGGGLPTNAGAIEPVRTAGAGSTVVTPVQIRDAAPESKPGTPLRDLWLRALVLAPNLQNYMSATALGVPDMRQLRPLMEKPAAVVAMRFGADPQPGLTTGRFTGSAVVFISTVAVDKRTAALR